MTLELSGAVTGAGTLSIAGQATLKLNFSAACTQSIGFAPSGTDAVLTLGMPLAVGALIENFAATDWIHLRWQLRQRRQRVFRRHDGSAR